MSIKKFKLKKFVSTNGTLIPFYLDKIENFTLKRFFILHGKKNCFRGDHAHKKCTQIFIPLSGKIKLEIVKKNKKIFKLNYKNQYALLVPPLNWCKISFLEKKSSILVLCNVKFSENEYIRKYKEFLKYL
tara:strand:+ start:1511 stop:1900 length:390 start_codon:yes stop_codon:yes gene_type:complete